MRSLAPLLSKAAARTRQFSQHIFKTTMTEHEEIRLKSLRKKLVSNSKAILLGHITMPMGSLKMEQIISWIEQIKPIAEIDLKVFSDYNNQTSDYPIGEDKIRYNAKFLDELDKKLGDVTSYFKIRIEEKCLEIIEKFAVEK